MDLYMVSVFNAGNGLRGGNSRGLPDAAISMRMMQAIAATLNLSETTFVTSSTRDSYDVRIFTPREELPGRRTPDLGDLLGPRSPTGCRVRPAGSSKAGETLVTRKGDRLWFARGRGPPRTSRTGVRRCLSR